MAMPKAVTGENQLKRCNRCGEDKPLDQFDKMANGKYGRRGQCKPCHLNRPELIERRTAQRNRWKEGKPEMDRNRHLQRYYGLSLDRFLEITEDQDGRCAICNEVVDPLHVDHDHTTEGVRGLLCGPCNRGLGCFKENSSLLLAAIDYLRRTDGKDLR